MESVLEDIGCTIIFLILTLLKVILNLDLATFATYSLDIGQEVTVEIVGLCQTVGGLVFGSSCSIQPEIQY